MNKTVTASIGGIHFHLEEAAYERFKNYLNSVSRSLSATEGRDEILQDIEARVAELLQEKLTNSLQVVTLDDIESVINAMGQPEDFGQATDERNAWQGDPAVSRKLFRDPDDKILGGVCSGIAAYLGVDALWLRLLFALLFFGFGTGLLLYIILWVVIPKAVTTADKLRMRGVPVNLSTIERNIREEMEEVKRRAQTMASSGRRHGEPFFRRLIGGTVDVIRYVLKAFVKVFAFVFLLTGLLVAFALFAGLLAAVLHVPGVDLPPPFISLFNKDNWFVWVMTAIALAVGLPFLALAWAGAKLLFNVRMPRAAGYVMLGLWLLGVVLTAYIGIQTARQFREEGSVRSSTVLPVTEQATLTVKSSDVDGLDEKYGDNNRGDDEWGFRSVNGQIRSKNVKMDIVESPDVQFHLVRLCYSHGEDIEMAAASAGRIDYEFAGQDSLLTLDRFLSLSEGEPFRNQRVQLVLQVPIGRKVFLHPSMEKIVYDIGNTDNIYDKDMTGRTWQMTQDGLRCLDCDGTEASIGGGADTIHGMIRIDESGISIQGDEGEKIVIDNKGVRVHGN